MLLSNQNFEFDNINTKWSWEWVWQWVARGNIQQSYIFFGLRLENVTITNVFVIRLEMKHAFVHVSLLLSPIWPASIPLFFHPNSPTSVPLSLPPHPPPSRCPAPHRTHTRERRMISEQPHPPTSGSWSEEEELPVSNLSVMASLVVGLAHQNLAINLLNCLW